MSAPVATTESDPLLRSDTTAATSRKGRSAARPELEVAWVGRARRVGWILLGLQLLGMLVFSTIEYERYSLSVGFATYAQAWVAIAHGHLDPMSTLIHKAFWRNDAEFVLWPLSLLYYVYPHPVDLLWVQDIAVVLTEAVTFGWILQVLGRRVPASAHAVSDDRVPDDQLSDDRGSVGRRPQVLAGVALLALLADPFCYHTIAYDFHSEVLAALFVVSAARAMWASRARRLALWVALALLTSGLAGLYLVGLGVSGTVAGRRTRRAGLVVLCAGVAWLVFVCLVGGNEFGFTDSLRGWYGYLVGPHHGAVGTLEVLSGLLSHPFTAAHMALSRWYLILDFLLAMGLVGVASPWGWPMAVVVILPSALNANVAFLNPHASFQTWPALPFVLVGSVMVLDQLAYAGARLLRALRGALALWVAVLVVLAGALVPNVLSFWLAVSPSSATQLARLDAEIPADAEVVASWGVVGRFADRSEVYAYGPSSRSFPVVRREVVFVLTPGQGVFEVSPRTARRAVGFVEHHLGAKALVAGDDVYGLVWVTPPGTSRVELP